MHIHAAITVGTSLLSELTSWLQRLGTPIGVLAFIACVIGWWVTRATAPHVSNRFLGGAALALIGTALVAGAPAIVAQFSGLTV